MEINFGIVTKYISERGFGFVTPITEKSNKKGFFFHIKTVKKHDALLASQLEENQENKPLTFWFQAEETAKGRQVSGILKPSIVDKQHHSLFSDISLEFESIWKDTKKSLPLWIHEASKSSFGTEQTQKWVSLRESLEQKEQEKLAEAARREEASLKFWLQAPETSKDKQVSNMPESSNSSFGSEQTQKRVTLRESLEQKEQERLAEAARELEAEIQELLKKDARKKDTILQQQQIEEEEFAALVEEIRPFGFTHSSQVSNYIRDNQLGRKYRHISGVVRIEQDGSSWDFNGGFPKKIYAQLCSELGLSSKRTNARVVGFKSYSEILG